MKNSNSIFLSLGSNIGDKESNLIDAVRLISNFAKIIKISSVYKTEPLLHKEQDDFFNIVIEIEYQGTARNLLIKIKEIETQMGRKKNFRYGPRLIDIDIIFFKGEEIEEEDLIIPHYDWQNRLFVVEPLYEVLNKPLDKSSSKIFDQKIINLDCSESWIWDQSSIEILDNITNKFKRHGKVLNILNLGPSSHKLLKKSGKNFKINILE